MVQPAGRNLRLLAASLLAPLVAGWLAGGSCVVAGCYEDCDPCFQACKCHTVCQNPVVGESGLRIVAHDSRVLRGTGDRFVRVLDVAVGPALVLSTGADPTARVDPARVAEFARRVLDVNADLFTAVPEPIWLLDAVHEFADGVVVQFALDPDGVARTRANSVSLLFDAHGRLREATHVVDPRS